MLPAILPVISHEVIFKFVIFVIFTIIFHRCLQRKVQPEEPEEEPEEEQTSMFILSNGKFEINPKMYEQEKEVYEDIRRAIEKQQNEIKPKILN